MARIDSIIHVGIKGTVIALDRATGAIVWQTPLKGGDFVNVVLDGDDLFATTKGEVFCLEPTDGRIRWQNPLKGFGLGLATIASGASSTPAMAQHRRNQDEASSAAAAGAAGAAGAA